MGGRTWVDAGEGWKTVVRRPKSFASDNPSRTTSRTNSFRKGIFNLFPSSLSSPPSTFSPPLLSSSPSTSSNPPFGVTMRAPRNSLCRASPALQSDFDWYTTDPATRVAYSKDPFLLGRIPFSLPAGPGKPDWNNRCFKCLVRGHSASSCRAPTQACPLCLQPGHGAPSCLAKGPKSKAQSKRTADILAALQPRGNLGDDLFPSNRTPLIDVYMPATSDSIDDLRYLNKGVVFDCRLKPGAFTTSAIQAALLLYAPAAAPFPVIHMLEDHFLLLLQGSTSRDAFIASVRSNLESIGIVTYPWSPAIGTKPVDYQFKVWIDLHHMPIQAWNNRRLLPLVAQFGLLLEHTSFSRMDSIERMRVLVAVRYLEDVTLAARLFFRAIKLPIPLTVLA